MSLAQATPLLLELETLVTTSGAAQQTRVKEVVAKLKRIIFLLPSNDPLSATKVEAELVASRRFHELCILYSIETKDINGFESAIKYLRSYYENYPTLPASADRSQIVALHLLYLLSFNKTRQYHSQVELISVEEATKSPFIHFVTLLERQIAMGNYSEVLQAKHTAPLKHFNFFLDRILETIRFETARSAEKAYTSLSITEAIKLFNLSGTDALKLFINEQAKLADDQGYNWVIVEERLVFRHRDASATALYNSTNLIATALSYAHEIEKII